jgi:hypothetical protein
LQGVRPDVELPDMFEASGMSERSEPTALKADSLAARPTYRPAMPWFSWHTVAGFADTAIRNDAGLQAIRNMVGAQPHDTETDTIPLSLAAFNAYMKQYDPPANVNRQGGTPIQVLNTRTDARLNELDSYHREMDESIRKNIAGDVYVYKAWQLLQTILSKR